MLAAIKLTNPFAPCNNEAMVASMLVGERTGSQVLHKLVVKRRRLPGQR